VTKKLEETNDSMQNQAQASVLGGDFDLEVVDEMMAEMEMAEMGDDETSLESTASTDSGIWERRVPQLPLLPIAVDEQDPSPRSPLELFAPVHAMVLSGGPPAAPRASQPRANVWASPAEAGGSAGGGACAAAVVWR